MLVGRSVPLRATEATRNWKQNLPPLHPVQRYRVFWVFPEKNVRASSMTAEVTTKNTVPILNAFEEQVSSGVHSSFWQRGKRHVIFSSSHPMFDIGSAENLTFVISWIHICRHLWNINSAPLGHKTPKCMIKCHTRQSWIECPPAFLSLINGINLTESSISYSLFELSS